MAARKSPLLSAQVVLKSAHGKSFDGQTAITAANIAELAPAPETIAAVVAGFRQAGFEVGEVVGISFSISAPQTVFEKVFKVRLETDGRGGHVVAGEKAAARGYELPVKSLAKDLSQHIEAVAFSTPLDFGPTNY